DSYAVVAVRGALLAGSRDATLDAASDHGGLAAVISRAKERDPAQRYQRADDLRDALRGVANSIDAPVTATVVEPAPAPAPVRPAVTPPPRGGAAPTPAGPRP